MRSQASPQLHAVLPLPLGPRGSGLCPRHGHLMLLPVLTSVPSLRKCLAHPLHAVHKIARRHPDRKMEMISHQDPNVDSLGESCARLLEQIYLGAIVSIVPQEAVLKREAQASSLSRKAGIFPVVTSLSQNSGWKPKLRNSQDGCSPFIRQPLKPRWTQSGGAFPW
jgi:hypothetical protein